jgi:hypothetical protein
VKHDAARDHAVAVDAHVLADAHALAEARALVHGRRPRDADLRLGLRCPEELEELRHRKLRVSDEDERAARRVMPRRVESLGDDGGRGPRARPSARVLLTSPSEASSSAWTPRIGTSPAPTRRPPTCAASVDVE